VWLCAAEFSSYKAEIRALDKAVGEHDFSHAVVSGIADKVGEQDRQAEERRGVSRDPDGGGASSWPTSRRSSSTPRT